MRSMVLQVAVAGVLLLPACASNRGRAEQAAPAPDDPVVLEVANHTWSDVDVFILASTMRARVGNVTSQGSERITVPHDLWAYGTIQVRVEAVGGAAPYSTGAIDIHGGQRITVSVEEQRGLSTWQVEDLTRW